MSFATLRRLRYIVLLLTRGDVAASKTHVAETGINTLRAHFAIHDILTTHCSKIPSVRS